LAFCAAADTVAAGRAPGAIANERGTVLSRLLRVALTCAALLLGLGAANAGASETCEGDNLALRATPIASSTIGGFWPLSGVNNGRADTDWTEGFWNDNTNGVWPDWVGVEWSQPTTIDRIIVRVPLMLSGYSTGAITLARSRVQYYDDSSSAWRDVVGRSGQDNPILDWIAAELVPDGREMRQFDFTALTTTRIRLLIEEGATSGWSWLDEIEAYDTDAECEPPVEQCENIALDGAPIASSEFGGAWPLVGVNNGRRDSEWTYGFWNDATRYVFPDWVGVEWAQPETIDRIVVRVPLMRAGWPVGEITLARSRVQYWDATASAWRDVVGRSGQDNPILNWTAAELVADGREMRQFDFTALTTTRIRLLIEEGATSGWSWLDEIEAYDTDAECGERPAARNLALPANGGEAVASSVHSSGTYPVTGVNNDIVEDGPGGYWNDGTNGTWPDWVGIEWDAPVTLDHIVATIPIARPGFPVGERTLERTRVQYYDDSASTWRDVVGRSGQDNPILDWIGPLSVPDGSESRRFDLGTLTTSSIRVLIEEGSTDGWSWLAEIEAWGWA
jgi:hypothetical protein